MHYKKKLIGIGLNTYNSAKYIKTLLLSLTKQTNKDFCLYVLDNKSNDNTKNIILSFKNTINIKFYTDIKRRNIPSSQKILVRKYLKNHEFSMIVNDDDKYNPEFISTVVKHLKRHNYDMVYANYNLFNEKKTLKTKNYPIYNYNKFNNVINFLIYRNIVPVFFGIYKTKTLIDSIGHYNPILKTKYNYDNSFMLYYLSNYKIGYIKKALFSYCIKNRLKINENNSSHRETYSEYKSLILIFFIQFNLKKKFLKFFLKSKKFNCYQKIFIIILSIVIYFQKCMSFSFRLICRKLLFK